MLNIAVAVKLWAPSWANRRVIIYCDNAAAAADAVSRYHISATYRERVAHLCTLGDYCQREIDSYLFKIIES